MQKTKKTKTPFIILLYLLLITPTTPRMKCNTKLLDTFKLSGLKYSVSEKMHICPMVQERCCTLMDELSILKLWNSFARPKLRMFHEQLFMKYQKIVQILELFKEQLPVENILVNYLNNKWVAYRAHYCSSVGYKELEDEERQAREMDSIFPGKGVIKKFDFDPADPVFEAQKEMVENAGLDVYLGLLKKMMSIEIIYYKYLKIIYEKEKGIKSLDLTKSLLSDIDFADVKDNFLDFQAKIRSKIQSDFDAVIESYKDKLEPVQIDSITNEFNKEYLKFTTRINAFMKDYNNVTQPFKRIDLIQDFEILLREKGEEFSKFIKHFKPRLEELELENELDEGENKEYDKINLKIESISKPPYNKNRVRKKILGKIAVESEMFKKERIYDTENDLMGSQTPDEFEAELKSFHYQNNPSTFLPIQKAKRRLKMIKSKKSEILEKLEIEEKKQTPDPERILLFKKLLKGAEDALEFADNIFINLKASVEYLTKPISIKSMSPTFYLEKDVTTPLKTLEKDQIKCSTEARYMYKNIVSNNKSKMKYCYDIHQKMAGLNTNILKLKLASAKISNMSVLELKRTIYCSVCDLTEQGNFNHKREMIVFEDEFCRSLIKEHESYLIFKNIIMIEFVNQVFQLAKCFDTSGNEYDFPFKGMLDAKKRRIKFFQRCLKNIDRPDFMMYCYFLCSDFKLMGYSRMWDGDVKLLNKVLFELYKFTSKTEIRDLPEVAQYLGDIQEQIVRDRPKREISHGKGESEAETEEISLQKKLDFFEKKMEYRVNQDIDSVGKMPDFSSPTSKLSPLPPFTSPSYIKKCKECDFGNEGTNCREKFCPPMSECDKCNFFRSKEYSDCRVKNCPAILEMKKTFDDKGLNLGDPRKLKKNGKLEGEKINVVKKVKKESKYITAEELGYRNLRQVDKTKNRIFKKTNKRILSEKKDKKTKTSKKETKTEKPRILSSVNGDEIYNRKKIPFNIPKYRSFYSKNIKGLNPLIIDAEINFERYDSSKLLKLQYSRYKPEKLDRNIVTSAMKISKKTLKAFKKDINLHFGNFYKKLRLTKKQREKLKRKKFYKNLSKSKVLKMISKRKRRFKKPMMPTFSYILNDVGSKSRDSASKMLLGGLHNVYHDPEDPRDWDPFSEGV